MKSLLPCVIILSLGIGHARADNLSSDPPTYEVNRTDAAPTIDGLVTEGEWDSASPAAGDWVGLMTGAADDQNLRFRMLWDDENLYILGETDYSTNPDNGWAGFGFPRDFKTDNPESIDEIYTPRMIFDPNADNEDWSAEDFDPTKPDGYSILWSMSEGFAARRPSPGRDNDFRDPFYENGDLVDYIVGFELEANVDSLSGNNGGWDITDEGTDNYRDNRHPGITFAQLAIDTPLDETEQAGGVFEFAIAWSSFNATDPESGNPLFDPEAPEYLENGLYHPMAPEENDIWGFEIGVKDPENALPSWSEPMGGNEDRESFAAWDAQHGRLLFTVEFPEFDCNRSGALDTDDLSCMTPETIDPTLAALNVLKGDLNGDGSVDFTDFITMSLKFGQPAANYTEGDTDLNGMVDFTDFITLSLVFGQSSPDPVAASVPEPSGLMLLGIAMLGLRRRRRAS